MSPGDTMGRLEVRKPLTVPQRKVIAVQVALKLNPVPLVDQVTEVSFDRGANSVVPVLPSDDDPLVRVPCEDGTVVFVCPWCENRQVEGHPGPEETPRPHPEIPPRGGLRFEVNGLFWHGTSCPRPVYLYSAAECGQPDYDDGW